jgi:Polyketide cyclase / dehydrase and lipid transport
VGELPVGQLVAGWLAILMLALGTIGLVRLSRTTTLVVVLAFLGIPLVGLVKYAFIPRPLGSFDLMYGALPFIGVAVSLIVASVLLRIGRSPSGSFASIIRGVPLFYVAWVCVVVAMSFVVLPFEPGFAVANVVATAIWFVLWIPRPLRLVASETSYELAAPPERVFTFISNPANWPLYLSDVELADVRPAGPLAVGSEIVTRRRLEIRGLRGPRLLIPQTIEAVEVVTRLVPGKVIASRRSDGVDAEATVELHAIDAGTAVSRVSTIAVPYRLALVGGVIEARLGMPKFRAQAAKAQERLRKLLEEQPPAK